MTVLPVFIGRLPAYSGFGGLSLGFFAILGGFALLVILGLFITLFRNLPYWIFHSWAHVTGFALGAYIYFLGKGWIAAVAVAGAGLAVSAIWITMIERQTERGRGALGWINRRLLKHAMK